MCAYSYWTLHGFWGFSCAPSSIPGSTLLQSLVVSNEIIFYIIVYLWHREQIAMIARVQASVPASQTMRRRKGWLMRSRRVRRASWWLVWCMRKRLCGKMVFSRKEYYISELKTRFWHLMTIQNRHAAGWRGELLELKGCSTTTCCCSCLSNIDGFFGTNIIIFIIQIWECRLIYDLYHVNILYIMLVPYHPSCHILRPRYSIIT